MVWMNDPMVNLVGITCDTQKKNCYQHRRMEANLNRRMEASLN